jgi:hypothetical protein
LTGSKTWKVRPGVANQFGADDRRSITTPGEVLR